MSIDAVVASAALALLVAGTAKAAVDILTHQEGNNVFEALGAWWDARTSWKRKYKDYDGGDQSAAFPGSKGWLVLFTDFWHLADSVYLTFYALGFFAAGYYCGTCDLDWQLVSGIFLVGRVEVSAVFELFYQKVFRKVKRA
jgi:hypothetical protein